MFSRREIKVHEDKLYLFQSSPADVRGRRYKKGNFSQEIIIVRITHEATTWKFNGGGFYNWKN